MENYGSQKIHKLNQLFESTNFWISVVKDLRFICVSVGISLNLGLILSFILEGIFIASWGYLQVGSWV